MTLRTQQFKKISLSDIDPPDGRIRLEISKDAVSELASNIQVNGLIHAILLRPKGNRYEIVAGERRFLAVQSLGWKEIPATVRDIDDRTVALLRSSENISRVDLTPIEEACTYKDLIDRFNMSYDQVAQEMGKSPGIVKRRLDLLKMPDCLQRAVHERKITYGVAEELWRISDFPSLEYYLSYAVDHGVTVSVARMWVKEWNDKRRRAQSDIEGAPSPASPSEPRPVYVTCDICFSAVEIGSDVFMRVCKSCGDMIKNASQSKGKVQ